MVRVHTSVFVSLAYRYWNSSWSREKNLHIFGSRASEEGMGGNWQLEAAVGVQPGEEPEIQSHLNFVKAQLDHQCLWEELPAFKNRPSTPENLTLHLGQALFSRALNQGQWASFTIHETPHFAVTLKPDGALSASIKANNLTLECALKLDEESGLGIARDQVTQEVKNLLISSSDPSPLTESEWAEVLLGRLTGPIPGLKSLRIDLGRQKYIVVNSKT